MLKKPFSFLLIAYITLFFPSISFAGTTPPTTAHTFTPTDPNGDNDWYISPVQVDLTASDMESGVKEINYRIDGGTWKKVSFSESLNLAPNPSFEDSGSTTSGLDKWEASVLSGATYSQDTLIYYPGYEVSAAKVEADGGAWHGINHKNNFVVASYLDNMTASAWLKSPSTTGQSRFRIYAVNSSGIATEIAQSALVIGKDEWTYVSLDFTVTTSDAIGIYMDVGIIGNGTFWADAVSISSEASGTTTSFVIGSDNANHTLDYYSVDFAGNIETMHTITFKIDQTPPGNWHDSGAIRSIIGPSDHHLYVYSTVEDATSGLSLDTNKYQYKPDNEETFGTHDDLMQCSSSWLSGIWASLSSSVLIPGSLSATLMTPKTDFCNSNWKVCKTVRFYAIDMAGNATTKDFCINGPWIKIRGGASVRSNHNIAMIAEGEDNNTDGIIEAAGSVIDFFTSTTGYKITLSDIPTTYLYEELYAMINSKNEITNGVIRSQSGVYEISGDLEIKNANLASGFSTNNFDQVVFLDGNLRISTDVSIADSSTLIFVVSGDVEIEKNVDNVKVAIVADGDIYTAYNAQEGQTSSQLFMKGLYSANKFHFQRTLQGTGNELSPSEDITFNPLYLVKLKDYFGGSTVKWIKTE